MIPFWQVGLGIGAEPPKTGRGCLRVWRKHSQQRVDARS